MAEVLFPATSYFLPNSPAGSKMIQWCTCCLWIFQTFTHKQKCVETIQLHSYLKIKNRQKKLLLLHLIMYTKIFHTAIKFGYFLTKKWMNSITRCYYIFWNDSRCLKHKMWNNNQQDLKFLVYIKKASKEIYSGFWNSR